MPQIFYHNTVTNIKKRWLLKDIILCQKIVQQQSVNCGWNLVQFITALVNEKILSWFGILCKLAG